MEENAPVFYSREYKRLAAGSQEERPLTALQAGNGMGRLFLKLGDKYLDIPEIDAAILSEPVSTTVVMAR